MIPLNQRRISDVSFLLDKNLKVRDANRSFLQLFDLTDFNISIAKFMESADAKNLKVFLKNFKDSEQNPYFVATVHQKRHKSCCIFFIKPQDSFFHIELQELSYSRELLDKALLESREYTALLKNFDSFYFTYDGSIFELKNTKDLNSMFTGTAEEFKIYFSNNFKIDLDNKDSRLIFETMISDVLAYNHDKNYKLHQITEEFVSIHTAKTSTRTTSIIVGNITAGKSSIENQNSYNEKKDGLTDLYNKNAITEIAKQRIKDLNSPFTLIILDVDKFKEFNDNFGHAFGDKVLVTVSNCIKESIGEAGIAGRIGGDEFLIILDRTDEETIRNVARNIRLGIQWSISMTDVDAVVTCSMGIARYPLNCQTYEDMFRIADKCLYIAKDRGRNCYIIYKPEIHDKIIMKNEKEESKMISGRILIESATYEKEFLETLEVKKGNYIQKAIDILREYMQINKITIYDDEFCPIYISGENDDDIRHDYFNENYFSFFNKSDFIHLDNVNVLDTLDKTKFFMYRDNNIASIIEVLNKDENGKMKSLVCFDIYRPARTFAKDKVVFALLAAKLISENL